MGTDDGTLEAIILNQSLTYAALEKIMPAQIHLKAVDPGHPEV